MSVDDIIPGSPLARALDGYPVPGLSPDFADRIVAAAEARPAPLPDLRRPAPVRGWRLGRRIMVGAACFGALATAAAATGVLERFDIPVPSAEKVWASITGNETPAAVAPVAPQPTQAAATTIAPVTIDGPIDTPEELGEAFRRIDEVRQGRSELRRQVIDQRIDNAIERRRAAGLPVPSAEQEARLRQRIDAVQAEREGRAAERIQARREELERKVESGEAVTRDDLRPARPQGATPRLRDLTPQERRALLRDLSPEDRRAVTEEYRRWRDQRDRQQLRRAQDAEAAAAPAPEAQTVTLPTDAAAPQAEPSTIEE